MQKLSKICQLQVKQDDINHQIIYFLPTSSPTVSAFLQNKAGVWNANDVYRILGKDISTIDQWRWNCNSCMGPPCHTQVASLLPVLTSWVQRGHCCQEVVTGDVEDVADHGGMVREAITQSVKRYTIMTGTEWRRPPKLLADLRISIRWRRVRNADGITKHPKKVLVSSNKISRGQRADFIIILLGYISGSHYLSQSVLSMSLSFIKWAAPASLSFCSNISNQVFPPCSKAQNVSRQCFAVNKAGCTYSRVAIAFLEPGD